MAAPNRVVVGSLAAVLALATPVVMKWEGTIYRGYKDPIGIVTACTGHTKTAKLGRVYTKAECDALLQGDMLEHGKPILACLPSDAPLEVRAAFVSFGFNVGVKAACGSTAAKLARAENYAGACAQLSKWNRAGGRVLPGLTKRRADERALCERGLAQSNPSRVTTRIIVHGY